MVINHSDVKYSSADFIEYALEEKILTWKSTVDRNTAVNRLVEFLNDSSIEYNQYDLNRILEDFNNYLEYYGMDTILSQIYSGLNIFEKEYDPYLAYYEKLNEEFSLDKNILDVASGHLPVFAGLIAKKQIELGKGKITLYDPKLVYKNYVPYNNMVLHKEKFTMNKRIEEFELITSTFPCEATKILLDRFIGTDKDLFIGLCSCTLHSYGFDPKDPSFRNWARTYNPNKIGAIVEYANNLCKRRGKGEIIVKKLDEKYNISSPILIYKK